MQVSTTRRNVTRYALIAAFGGFVFGLDAANISGAMRYVSALFGLSSTQAGLVASVPLVGVIFALFFTGMLCDRFGRKRILLAIAYTYLVSAALSAFAPSYEVLVLGRFIGGVAFASLTVSAMYIGEIAPADQRGRFVSVSQLLITLGSLLAFIVNYFLVGWIDDVAMFTDQNIWRFMLGFEIIFNVIWIAALYTIPKSPRWLISKGQDIEAREIFAKTLPEDQVAAVLADVEQSVENETRTDVVVQLGKLFSRPMWYVLAVACIYAVVQGATGMNAVLFFAPTVFEQVGMTTEDTFFQTMILGLVAVLGTLVAISLVEKWGRRTLTLLGLGLVVVAHTSTWYGFNSATYELNEASITQITAADPEFETSRLDGLVGNVYESDVELKTDLASIYSLEELPLVSGAIIDSTITIEPFFVLFGLFAFYAAFNMSIGPIMWVIFSELFPTSVRSVALPFVALVQTISSYAITQAFPWQLENMGSATTFLIFAVIGVIGLVAMYFLLPETKGKTIEQLEQELIRT
ncbi:MFS transporter [Erythrobacter sp. F6033]|uniref:MFS transporter n=1 Tax=Erythrobacter sp. F6033 TaxID=2926401 RepID=UPI001FF6BC62|nr:MFS transporter [Erythrobacter sp. F6033]MCK0129284.1 MFS transporter [Erythrobacter sp. F6033]